MEETTIVLSDTAMQLHHRDKMKLYILQSEADSPWGRAENAARFLRGKLRTLIIAARKKRSLHSLKGCHPACLYADGHKLTVQIIQRDSLQELVKNNKKKKISRGCFFIIPDILTCIKSQIYTPNSP